MADQGDERLYLREPVNVPDALERDKLVRRRRFLRKQVERDLTTWEHWNRTHPEEEPLDTSVEKAIIAWLDGKGPPPEVLRERLP